jgi:hypothetical protein
MWGWDRAGEAEPHRYSGAAEPLRKSSESQFFHTFRASRHSPRNPRPSAEQATEPRECVNSSAAQTLTHGAARS